MRKNVLSMSIAAMIGGLGLVGSANAVVFATGAATNYAQPNTGVGNVLIIPYFTTQSGNNTLLNIVNTDTANGKAVKVRFRGASNSDDIFDFQLYLSPSDVWTANVSQGADGRSVLTTSDKTCTLPAVVGTSATGNPFDVSRLPASMTADQKAAETREGYIEILTMANVPKGVQNGQFATNLLTTNNPLWDAIKHVSGVAPCTAGTLASLANEPTLETSGQIPGASATEAPANGQGGAASAMGLVKPTGSLFANYTVINVPKTQAFAGEAVALLTSLAATPNTPATGNLIFYPQTSALVRAAAVNAATAETSDPLLLTSAVVTHLTGASAGPVASAGATAVISARQFDLPDLSTPQTGAGFAIAQADILSAALTATSTINEQLGNTAIAANTDWTFSMPTRRYHVAMNYNWSLAATAAFNNALDGRVFVNRDGTGASAVAASPALFNATNTSVNSAAGKTHQICVGADTIQSWDREETTSSGGFVISPAIAATVRFCGEVSVLSFNAGGDTQPSVLASTLARQDVTTAFLDGWSRITHAGLASRGLPVLGRSYTKAQNGSVFFGIGANHRYTRP